MNDILLFFKDPNAATPSKGKKGKKEKGGKKEDEEKDGATSPEVKVTSAQEQMAAMRESGKLLDLPVIFFLNTLLE